MRRRCIVAITTGLLTILCGVSATLAGPFDDFNLYFVNGMDNSQDQAETSKKALQTLVVPDAPNTNVDRLYNSTEGVLADLLETYRLGSLDSSQEEYKNFWRWLDNLNLAPAWYMNNIYGPTLAKYNETAYAQFTDLPLMLTKLNSKAQATSRKKTILVAHSEGNFYANQIVNNLQTTNPSLAPCVGVVAVATPAIYVAGGVPYTTLRNDVVINLARDNFPWGSQILPPSPPDLLFNSKDLSGHAFVPSYLEPLNARIRGHVVDVANQISAKVECAPPPTTSCGTPISASGSSGSYQYALTAQGTPTVTATFESYSIPDELELYANGVKLAGTGGLVSGFRSYSIPFDSQKLGTGLTDFLYQVHRSLLHHRAL